MTKINLKEEFKKIPLENRIRVSNTTSMIDLVVELGIRESKSWPEDDPESERMLSIINSVSQKLTESHIKTIKEWEKDGRPIKKS